MQGPSQGRCLPPRSQLAQLPARGTGVDQDIMPLWVATTSTLSVARRGSESRHWRSGCWRSTGSPWLPTDVLRTVLRRVLPQLDAIDQDPVDDSLLAEFMYPHVEQAAEVYAEEAACFLIEGFELSPFYLARLQAALAEIEVHGCFLGARLLLG